MSWIVRTERKNCKNSFLQGAFPAHMGTSLQNDLKIQIPLQKILYFCGRYLYYLTIYVYNRVDTYSIYSEMEWTNHGESQADLFR